jgi:glutamate synthase (NADPH/NADH) small chain
MDAARTALRLGAEKVYIVYRRSMDELPARREEVEHAIEEGIEFNLLTNPIEILGYRGSEKNDPKNGFVCGIKCTKMELGEPDERGRRRPIPVDNSEFVLDVDTVVISIGTTPNPLIKMTTDGLEVNKRGGIIVEENTGATTRNGVFAGGDAVTGAATVISAMGAGKTAAKAIDEYISYMNNKEE